MLGGCLEHQKRRVCELEVQLSQLRCSDQDVLSSACQRQETTGIALAPTEGEAFTPHIHTER